MLNVLVYPLYAFFAVARIVTRFGLVQKPKETSSLTRPHGNLEFLNWISLIGLVAAFFMHLNLTGDWLGALLIVGTLIVCDWAMRWLFLQLAVRRLCRSSKRMNRDSALRQVCRRAGYADQPLRIFPRKTQKRSRTPHRREALHV